MDEVYIDVSDDDGVSDKKEIQMMVTASGMALFVYSTELNWVRGLKYRSVVFVTVR